MDLKKLENSSKEAESLLKTLANSNRLMILCYLIKGPMTVSGLSESLALSQSAVSQHLLRLKQSDIVLVESKGKHAWYRIDSAEVTALMAVIQLIYCRNEEDLL
ncbi:ArsR family transcriptional regulator [Glaciecola punicea]|uniref:ArsR/SmtB family transcription factor n=1 Tax=Glaciecola punicea TaxID=56804 RepID=UPI000872DFEA|nr:metalloregulator ArsR/SmtB family transcription factor [Glaciecola punicea]OFA30934.1 ArsR family transcriptional regulator [Glaciecola punicea]